MASIIVIVGAAVAALGSLLTYLAAARKLSGRIQTTDATELWAESRSLRDNYRDQLSLTNDRLARMEARVASLEALNTDLSRENLRLTRENAVLEKRVDDLESENAHLKEQLAALEART